MNVDKKNGLKQNPSMLSMVGQFFMPAAFINDTPEAIEAMELLIKTSHIGGLCFFHSPASAATNFEGKKKVIFNKHSKEVLRNLIDRYQKASPTPLLIAIDAEWGLAMRVENIPAYPYALSLGAIEDREDLIENVGYLVGKECREIGIHWNFAPVTDCNTNPDNPVIGYRSFGSEKTLVAKKAMAFARGMKQAGIMNCIKHFPGHGDTATDSHLALPVLKKSRAELKDQELYPFQFCIKEGIDAVMIGHLAVPEIEPGDALPASLSEAVIRDLLKKELGYDGMVVTDALNMHAVTKLFTNPGQVELQAFRAGNDILCFPTSVKKAIELIIEESSESEIIKRYQRVKEFKFRAFERKELPHPTNVSRDAVMVDLAEQSLCFYKGKSNTLDMAKKSAIVGLTIGAEPSLFHQDIQKSVQYPLLPSGSGNTKEILDKAAAYPYLLLAVYPPQIRPRNNFGFDDNTIRLVRELATRSKVILYHFGNPYALQLWDLSIFNSIVIAFQDFPEFQQNAARHFLGEIEAKGTLPVRLNSANYDKV